MHTPVSAFAGERCCKILLPVQALPTECDVRGKPRMHLNRCHAGMCEKWRESRRQRKFHGGAASDQAFTCNHAKCSIDGVERAGVGVLPPCSGEFPVERLARKDRRTRQVTTGEFTIEEDSVGFESPRQQRFTHAPQGSVRLVNDEKATPAMLLGRLHVEFNEFRIRFEYKVNHGNEYNVAEGSECPGNPRHGLLKRCLCDGNFWVVGEFGEFTFDSWEQNWFQLGGDIRIERLGETFSAGNNVGAVIPNQRFPVAPRGIEKRPSQVLGRWFHNFRVVQFRCARIGVLPAGQFARRLMGVNTLLSMADSQNGLSSDRGRVVLFGATGFTGRLTAVAMTRAGLAPVFAGRRADKLQELTDSLTHLAPTGQEPSWQQANADDESSVRALLASPRDTLVSTVGPFTQVGHTAIEAVARAGCTYIDSTGEGGFIKSLFDRSAELARNGARFIPACGYDYVPGNLAGAIAVRAAKEAGDYPARIDIGYFTKGPMVMSSGTKASALASLGTPGFTYRAGAIVPAHFGSEFREFTLAHGATVGGISIGASEHFGLPRFAPELLDVNVFLGWAGKSSKAISLVAKATGPITTAPGINAITARLGSWATHKAMATTAQGPSGKELFDGQSIAIASVTDRVGRVISTVQVNGPAPYPLTAEILAWAAAMSHAGRISGVGTLDPVSAFGLGPLIAGCSAMGLTQVRHRG